MLPENEHFIREFEKIVNKVHSRYFGKKKHSTVISKDDLLDIEMIFGLSTNKNGIIDTDKLINNLYIYG